MPPNSPTCCSPNVCRGSSDGAAAEGGRCVALVTETDAPALQIVGRHFNDHPVADTRADAELAHLAGRVGQDFVIIVELHPEVAVRENLGDGTVKFQQLFFRHPVDSNCLTVAGGRRCGAAHSGA